MLCGGSGITPILQVLKGVIEDPEDTETEMWCIDANKSFEDIRECLEESKGETTKLIHFYTLKPVCREELDELVKKSNGRFKLHHTLSATPEGWTGSKGRMTRAMYDAHLPTPSEDALVLICGPDAMINQTAKPLLVRFPLSVARG